MDIARDAMMMHEKGENLKDIRTHIEEKYQAPGRGTPTPLPPV
ncbi:MAG: hypothetical protein HYY09_02470 [Firmicutes bacterium]|nr:hypothetical protein [Bacillota bacterium]